MGAHQLVPTHRLETTFGIIEYADQGEGVPLLVSHGVLGCHIDTSGGWWADLPGPGFRVIGPSRFGYFGSTLPNDATPADQADAYALLLDHLDIDRAVVIAFSAGSGSVLEFARLEWLPKLRVEGREAEHEPVLVPVPEPTAASAR